MLLLLDSKSLAVLLLAFALELVVLEMIDFTLDLILMRLILIFGEGVNERTTSMSNSSSSSSSM